MATDVNNMYKITWRHYGDSATAGLIVVERNKLKAKSFFFDTAGKDCTVQDALDSAKKWIQQREEAAAKIRAVLEVGEL
jgi:hypothetical protein